MKIMQIVLKELFQRNNQVVMCLIAVSLGVAVIVAIESTTHHSEKAVSGELDALGANILPESTGTSRLFGIFRWK